MPKMKTNRGAAKRFKLKKNLIKRGSAFKSHILTKKRPRKIANLNAPKYVNDANIESVKKMLCMAQTREKFHTLKYVIPQVFWASLVEIPHHNIINDGKGLKWQE